MPSKKPKPNTDANQQNIEFMFNAIKHRNSNPNTNKHWHKRQPGLLASPPREHSHPCPNRPFITVNNNTHEHKSTECQTQHLHTHSRKRKLHMISSPNHHTDHAPNRKRLKSLSISPSKPKPSQSNPFFSNSNHATHNTDTHNTFPPFHFHSESDKKKDNSKIDLFSFEPNKHVNNDSNQSKIDLFTFNSRETKYNYTNTNNLNSIDEINLFTSFDEDRTPARNNKHMTQYRRQRVLNQISNSKSIPSEKRKKRHRNLDSQESIPSSASKSSNTIPSSASKSSIASVNDRNQKIIQKKVNPPKRKKSKTKKKKIIIETEEDIENIMSVDPRRLSLEDHPLILRRYNNNIYSQNCDESDPDSPPHNHKLTCLLDSLLNESCAEMDTITETNVLDSNDTNDCDYFDNELDESALVMALNGIESHKTQKRNIIKRLSFDNSNSKLPQTPPRTSIVPAIDFSPNSKRKVNSPLSQRTMSRSHSIGVGLHKNMGSIDPMTQNLYTQEQESVEEKEKCRYYRFEVMDITADYDTRSKVLRVKDLSEKEGMTVENAREWTVEIRQDWYESIVCIGDIVHIIGETVETMRVLFCREEGLQCGDNSIAYPKSMIPNENVPMIIDISTDIIIDNLHNYIVIHPDCLMAPGTIAGSFPCVRKEVLKNNIRFSQEKDFFLFGTMAHELFQETLKKGRCDGFDLQNDLSIILSKYLVQLYCINETEQTATARLSEFIPNITSFFYKYMQDTSVKQDNIVDWGAYEQELHVTKVVDIEENIWSPMFGVRGYIDATVQTKSKRHLSFLERQYQKNGQLTQQTQSMHEFIHKLLPFELKTGKDNVYAVQKARAQLAMYSLMMADRYDTSTDGGLLYFLKSGNVYGVPLPHNEIRALLIRRNFLAKYFNSHPRVETNMNDSVMSVKVRHKNKDKRKQKEFPNILPLAQKRNCEKCFSKQECFIYHKIQCYNNGIEDVSSANITSTDVYAEQVRHLNNTHLEYMNKWIELIDLEETHCLGTRHEIWAMDSVKRERKTGKCLANMIVSDHCTQQYKHIYTFIKHPDYYTHNNGGKYERNMFGNDKDIIKLWDLKFRINDYITISTEDGKYGLGSGTIIELNTKYVKFASKKPIKILSEIIQDIHCTQQRSETVRYRLDIDDTAYGYSGLRANVFYYFFAAQTDMNDCANSAENEIKEIIARKRELLIDLYKPKFTAMNNNYFHKIPTHLRNAYNLLNIDQKTAVKHVLECNDYALILGMPGTGKSATIIFLLRLLISFGYKVLLSAYTNSAVDHLCLKLLHHSDVKDKFVRIGNVLSINNKLSNYVLDALDKSKLDSIAAMDKYLETKHIFAVTSTSATSHGLFTSDRLGIFDYSIIDEAGQLTEPQVLGPLRKCRRFVLVGDNYQLPPLVQCRESAQKGMSVSLFEKLANKYETLAVKALTIQYRMNRDILYLSNALTYNGQMKCANDMIAQRKIKLSHCTDGELMKDWLKCALNPDKNVILFNTDGLYNECEMTEVKSGRNNSNAKEAHMIELIVNHLFKYGIYSSQIGVMAPYRSQLKLIKSKLDGLNVPLSPSQCLSQTEEKSQQKQRESSLLLDTIDRFQGSDRDVILISFTHTKFDTKVGAILNDWRRINVALTRAKCKLILIASLTAFKQSKSNVLKRIVEITDKQKWIYNLSDY